VLSSRWEGLSLTVIEGMLAGLPVVATRVGGTAELVQDGVTGWLVPPQDERALASALGRLLDDPHQRRTMGEAGRQRALRRLTADRMAADVKALYATRLSTRVRRRSG
jgi:glycosyltransferase involved in cell wall biosynthesis